MGTTRLRRSDPRIETQVHIALHDARTVVNVVAGAGSYEPADRYVLEVEPSVAMRALRPRGVTPAVATTAERLPFYGGAFDATMALLTFTSGPSHAGSC